MSGGMNTLAVLRPASPLSWLMAEVSVGFSPATRRFFTVSVALNEGEKGSLPQPVNANGGFESATAVAPVLLTAVKLACSSPHEVGFRRNGLPVPGATPNRLRSIVLIVIGTLTFVPP